jgi:ssDNA-binding Zn-finger/Zn-ribbon topoisomerase 1
MKLATQDKSLKITRKCPVCGKRKLGYDYFRKLIACSNCKYENHKVI